MRKAIAFFVGITIIAASVFAESKIVPPISITQGVADGRYGQLAAANIWSGTNRFTAVLDWADGTRTAPGLAPTSIGNSGWYVESSTIKMSILGVESVAYASGSITFSKDILMTKALTVNGNTIFGNSGTDTAAFNARSVSFPNLAVHTYAGSLTYNFDGIPTFDATGFSPLMLGVTWDFTGSTNVTVPDANAATEAMNQQISDGRYFNILGDTVTGPALFNDAVTLGDADGDLLEAKTLLTLNDGTAGVGGFTFSGSSIDVFAASSINYRVRVSAVDMINLTNAVMNLGNVGTHAAPIHIHGPLQQNRNIDGAMVGASLENSQANAAASTNETTEIHFGFGGILDAASIAAIKEQDYTSAANEDSALVFSTDLNGVRTEKARVDSAGNFGINTKSPDGALDVEGGGIYVSEIAAPATPATDKGVFYEKSDGKPYFKNDAGTEFDLSANGATKEVSVGVAANTDLKGDRAVASLTTNGSASFTLPIPIDFVTLVSLEVLTIPGTTGSGKDVDLFSDYSAAGEAFQTHSESNTTITYVFTTDQLDAFDVSSVATSIAAGDSFGIRWVQNAAGANNIVCLRLKYN